MADAVSDTPILTLSGLRDAQAARRRRFSITPAARPGAWTVRDGALQHGSGGFFSVSGFEEPVTGRQHLLLHQPQGALNGWVSTRRAGARLYLVQSRAEPGNVDGVQFGPTLQSTPANYLRLHGGAPSAFMELFLRYTPDVTLMLDTQQLDQGGRYAQKTKRVALVEQNAPLELPTGFHWASTDAMVEAAGKDFLLNTDFKAGLAVLPWSSDAASGELVPRSEIVRRSLDAPLCAEVIGAAVASVDGAVRPLRAIPLEALADWHVTPDGILPRSDRSRVSVGFYECTADAREVKRWVQPLMKAEGQGVVALACRLRDGLLEVHVAHAREVGLPVGAALGPSFIAYPGKPVDLPDWMTSDDAAQWIGTRESDEGGRFLDHWSHYRLVMVPPDQPMDAPGTWMNVAELKAVMRVSNLCTIQLRTLTALLLAAEDLAG